MILASPPPINRLFRDYGRMSSSTPSTSYFHYTADECYRAACRTVKERLAETARFRDILTTPHAADYYILLTCYTFHISAFNALSLMFDASEA
jgi:hypothetical protein